MGYLTVFSIFIRYLAITDCRRPRSARLGRGGSRSPGETQITFSFSQKKRHKWILNHVPKTIWGLQMFNIFAQSDIYREYRHWPSRPHIELTSTLKWHLGNKSCLGCNVLSILFHIFAQSDINIEVTPCPQKCSQTSWAVSGQKRDEPELSTKPEVI